MPKNTLKTTLIYSVDCIMFLFKEHLIQEYSENENVYDACIYVFSLKRLGLKVFLLYIT